MISIAKRLARRVLKKASVRPEARPAATSHIAQTILSGSKYVSDPQIAALDELLEAAAEPAQVAEAIVGYVSAKPYCAALVGCSDAYLARLPNSRAALLVYIAANYLSGGNARCVKAARRLLGIWPSEFAHIVLARCLEQTEGASAEHSALTAGLREFPDSKVLHLSLIENLIGTGQVTAANDALTPILGHVQIELADEIETVKANQVDLDKAIRDGTFAPAGGADIYTDDFCRMYWLSYYESYVTRSERYHGDRLLLRKFVEWVEAVRDEIDVILDFGSLCAQPLFEAASAAPNVRIIGTDRQKFLADLNAAAYPAPNLTFDFGDIFEVMERVARLPGHKALTHVRTACTLYPAFVDKLYAEARRLGFSHIYFIENAGFVRSRLQFMSYDDMEVPAIVTKHRLNHHNYKQLLGKHGYTARSVGRVRGPGLWRGYHPANYLGAQLEVHAS